MGCSQDSTLTPTLRAPVPLWTKLLSHQNLGATFHRPHADPLPSPSVFLENRAGAQQPCQHVSTHALTQSTHFCSSKSVLTSELARCQPGLTQGHLPAPPTPKAHFWGPWKCPPLSGPQVLGVSPHGGKNTTGGDEPGKPAALVVTSKTWPSLALFGPPWPFLAFS